MISYRGNGIANENEKSIERDKKKKRISKVVSVKVDEIGQLRESVLFQRLEKRYVRTSIVETIDSVRFAKMSKIVSPRINFPVRVDRYDARGWIEIRRARRN